MEEILKNNENATRGQFIDDYNSYPQCFFFLIIFNEMTFF